MASRNPHKRYTETHWGIEPTTVLIYEGPHYDVYPDDLVEMGKLHQLQYWPGTSRNHRDLQAIEFEGDLCTLAFSPRADEKLFPLYPCAEADVLARRFWRYSKSNTVDLQELNQLVGGRQSRYPFIGGKAMGRTARAREVHHLVQPLGVLEAVAYGTEKKGDGPSTYHHTHGEEGGHQPVLAIDVRGRLWICGGSYTVKPPGIAD